MAARLLTEFINFNDMRYIKNKIGDKVGSMIFLGLSHRVGKRSYYFFKCHCGNNVTKMLYGIKDNSSCGCSLKEQRSNAGKKCKTHGSSNKRLYHIWENMKQRCYNPKSHHYKHYGGKGILICDSWLNRFESFREWAENNGYQDNLTIDRINLNENYNHENCRWITNFLQQANTSKTVIIEYNGERAHISEWARRIGINRSLLGRRLRYLSIEKALTQPVRKMA